MRSLVPIVFLAFVCSSYSDSTDEKIEHPKAASNPSLRFRESEIRTRTWVAAGGAKMGLLNLEINHLNKDVDFVIVKYGQIGTTNVMCLDFYEQYPALPNGEKWLNLVGHDYSVGRIEQVSLIRENGQILINVSRRFIDSATKKLMQSDYQEEYRNHQIIPGISELIHEVH